MKKILIKWFKRRRFRKALKKPDSNQAGLLFEFRKVPVSKKEKVDFLLLASPGSTELKPWPANCFARLPERARQDLCHEAQAAGYILDC